MSVKGKRRMDIRVFDPLHFSQIYLVVVLGAAATHLFGYFVCKTFVPTKKWHVSLTCEMSNFSAKVNRAGSVSEFSVFGSVRFFNFRLRFGSVC